MDIFFGGSAVDILIGLNKTLSAAITILAFALFAYMVFYNVGSSVGRGFAALLACVCFTYTGDVLLYNVTSLQVAIPWLKFQWIGIAFIPAAYLHFADALLRMTNAHSSRRRFTVLVAYFFGFILILLAIQTEHLVRDPFTSPGVTQFRAGPFFWVFTIYFYTTLTWGVYKIFRARARSLTSQSRRHMTGLGISFAAPALGVFPYMLIASSSVGLHPALLLIVLLLVNIGIGAMMLVMAYSVAFLGALSPERVITHRWVHFLLRGPLVATLVILIFLALPHQNQILGLSRDLVFLTSIVAVLVLSQIAIDLAKPAIDRLIFYKDRQEVAWISELDRRLLTTNDLQQALENVLTALCEVLQIQTGFIYNLAAEQGPRLETQVGVSDTIKQAVADIDVTNLIEARNGQGGYHFISQNDFWFVLLQNKARDKYLGLLGLEARSETYDLTSEEEKTAALLIEQVEIILEDRQLQKQVFAALKNIIPEIERVQRLRSAVRYEGSPGLTILTESPVNQHDFSQMVRDALTHYWGGPKLTKSPLLGLRVVQEALLENDSNAVRALRAVLAQAIERQRPEGERRLTTAEWLMYNILDYKFVQGMRVRDIAQRLAMSEADLYRKQKLAIEEVARTLKDMETQDSPKLTAPTSKST
ncbi:MAG: histidine kinase N-terminal 7TM domain-containing protein [Anaerolineae bacterium]|nr:histidine kinase N-terminal 7TM domain-containing protein [Anaerolineae bacterium]